VSIRKLPTDILSLPTSSDPAHPRKRRFVILSAAKDLQILRRPAAGGTPQNDILEHVFPRTLIKT